MKPMSIEARIRGPEAELFAAVGVDVEESFLDLAGNGLRCAC